MNVSSIYTEPGTDGEEYVEVTFSSAHDYETVPGEGRGRGGGLQAQKSLPTWSAALHRLLARIILDLGVRELKWESERKGKGL